MYGSKCVSLRNCLCLVSIIALLAGCGKKVQMIESRTEIIDPKIEAAKAFFDRFTQLGNAFDPAVAGLYADDARIRSKRTYPGGRERTIVIPAPTYKKMLSRIMPLAKARGDRSSLTNVTYKVEDDGVRIAAIRHSHLKNYDSPYELLVAPDADGNWLIKEELSESRVFGFGDIFNARRRNPNGNSMRSEP